MAPPAWTLALALTLLLAAAGCAGPAPREAASHPPAAAHRIYVVRAADVPQDAWPARRDFPDAGFLEVGWGDRAYYQAPDPGLWLGLRALLWPTPGVLHFAAFDEAPEHYFATARIVELGLAAPGFAALLAAVRDSHEFDAAGRPLPLGPGLYGASRFYASRERFHLGRTCNVWTATVLAAAGVPIEPARAVTAGALLAQLRAHGLVLRVPYRHQVGNIAGVRRRRRTWRARPPPPSSPAAPLPPPRICPDTTAGGSAGRFPAG